MAQDDAREDDKRGPSRSKKVAKTTRWATAAREREKSLMKGVQENLRTVAECFATHEQAETVSPKHVDEAFNGIARLGLTQRPWIDRPETEITVGAALVGFAFALPDVVNVLFAGTQPNGLETAALVTCFTLGVIGFTHGHYRARMPSAGTRPNTWRNWARRVAIVTAALLLVSAIVIWAKAFTDSCRTPELAPPMTGPTPDPLFSPEIP